MDYSSRIRQINSRYNPDNNLLVEQRSFSTLDGIDGDLRKYIKLAMNEVDEEYTAKTIEAGNRAKAHLQAEQFGIDYRFQGSVMTQTHIKGASDIDLLTLTNKFVSTDISKMRSILEKGLLIIHIQPRVVCSVILIISAVMEEIICRT